MKFFIFFLVLFSGCIASSDQPNIIITNVDVFDGENIIKKVDFVFSVDGIESIASNTRPGKKSTIIDGTGKTIIPPMINAHVHVRTAENLKEALEVGIFGVLDMFSTDSRANGFRAYNDSLRYAKFYSSNVGATAPSGHGTQFGVDIPTITDTISAKEFIMDRINENADYIKITHEYSMAKLDTVSLKAVIEKTHQLEKIAVGHISELKNGMEIINQGVDGLAHIWYRKNSFAANEDLASIKEKEVFVIPTLSVIFKLIESAAQPDLQGSFLTKEELILEVKKLNQQGITILAGTDSPNFGMNYTTQFFEELILLKKCGLTDIEILKTATINVYRTFELEDFGGLEQGSKASFVLVDGAPYNQIEAIKNEKRVWKNGIEI